MASESAGAAAPMDTVDKTKAARPHLTAAV